MRWRVGCAARAAGERIRDSLAGRAQRAKLAVIGSPRSTDAPRRAPTYAASGVAIDEAERAVERLKRYARATFAGNVPAGIGAFGGAYALGAERFRQPVLIASADGVGTKLNVACALNKHDTIGQCLVNHCVNDIAVQGAQPLFFLDYFAAGKLDARVVEQVVKGLARACKQNGAALIGGETAEMPGMYAPGAYDLAGFVVGACERTELLDGRRARAGSVLIGLPSTGLHTNGYSLARKLFFETAGYKIDTRVPQLRTTVGNELLKIHRSYLRPLRALAAAGLLLGAAHVTGGGITGNTPRMLPARCRARIQWGSWRVPPVFKLLQRLGGIDDAEMLQTFNMGLGLIVCAPRAEADRALAVLRELNEKPTVVGSVERGAREVVYR